MIWTEEDDGFNVLVLQLYKILVSPYFYVITTLLGFLMVPGLNDVFAAYCVCSRGEQDSITGG